MPEFTNTPPLLVTPKVKLYKKQKWADSWTAMDHVHMEQFNYVASPNISHAVLSFIHGNVKQASEATFSLYDPLDLVNSLVKITFDEDEDNHWAWGGIIAEDQRSARAIVDRESSFPIKWGRQKLIVMGFEYLLDRMFVITSKTESGTIQRGIPFNRKNQYSTEIKRVIGNRAATAEMDGSYRFSNNLATAKIWSSLDIAKYLVVNFQPEDVNGSVAIPFRFRDLPGLTNAYYDTPIMPTDGMTVKALLDRALDRRRNLGYVVRFREEFGEDPEYISFEPFTFCQADLAATIDGVDIMIPANDEQGNWSIDFAADATYKQKKDASSYTNQVFVRGRRATATFSVSPKNSTLVPQWSLDVQTAYERAAMDTSAYAGLGANDIEQKQAINAIARKQDQVTKAFSYWGLPSNWDGSVYDALTDSTELIYFPDPDLEPVEPLAFYFPDLRILHHTTLRTEFDYASEEHANQMLDKQAWEYKPIFGIARLYDRVINGYQWSLLDKMNSTDGTFISAHYNVSIRPQADAPGVVLKVHGGPQHLIGLLSTFSIGLKPEDDKYIRADDSLFYDYPHNDTASENYSTTFDYHDLIVTLCMEVDLRCEGHAANVLLTGQVYRTEVIDVGDRGRLDFIARGTVVDLVDGAPVISNGEFPQDDRPLLTALAQFALSWYGQPRMSFVSSVNRRITGVVVGSLIHRVGSDVGGYETADSVITRMTMEFPEAEGFEAPARTYEIETQYGELDVAGYLV